MLNKLQKFMAYSAPEEVEDLAQIFIGKNDSVSKKDLVSNISKHIKVKIYDSASSKSKYLTGI